MAVVEWTAQAEEDLIDIWVYISQDNPAAADDLLDEIDGKCALLAANPYIGIWDRLAQISRRSCDTFR